ncbi:MAG: class I SAM-dependent methyltransferase [Fibrobacteria bacterium]|nr:class I SAM-dependent methyltransferase [Fibrobacteria bacterium]
MEPQTYKQLSDIEERHWWHKARKSIIADYIKEMALPENAQILDIGCGPGGTTVSLTKWGAVHGLEKSEEAYAIVKKKYPSIHLTLGDGNQAAKYYPNKKFDLITAFHVMYHKWIPDDAAFLKMVHEMLKPGGCILFTDPAYQILWRTSDILDMGKSRYTLGYLQRLFTEAGFIVKKKRIYMASMFLPALAAALWDKFRSHNPDTQGLVSEMQVPPAGINLLLYWYCRIEVFLYKFIPLPLGIITVVSAKRI